MKLFQNLIIPGDVEGLDHDFQIPTCTFADPPLEEITPAKNSLRQKNAIR